MIHYTDDYGVTHTEFEVDYKRWLGIEDSPEGSVVYEVWNDHYNSMHSRRLAEFLDSVEAYNFCDDFIKALQEA